ncbi:MOSC domain-containing protein [Cryptosporangium sp. NPDC051539]|uniref:MOSC domain-containing protein n=1 Tax=Cryptosporangium sp. NPDC051539 TaxID=3363962 RepID=UPI0037BAEC78
MVTPTLLSLNVGMPKDVAWHDKTVRTGIWKTPVTGPRMARRLNIDGDGQGDLGGHGGENRAVLVYQLESIEYWRTVLDRPDIGYGHFGENFTVTGLADDEVCIGDRYRIGDAEFEVTQPRVTCYRLGLRLGTPNLPALLVSHHRPGFYLRVLAEGAVGAGDRIVRTRRGPHEMTVAEIDALLYLPGRDRGRLEDAVDVPALSPGWQGSFRDLLDGGAAATSAWTGFRALRVTDLTRESSTIRSVRLASPDGSPLPPARPGQYVTLRVDGAVRSYSLSSEPGDATYRISVKRDGRVSTFLHTALRVGAEVETAAPRGEFVLAPGDEPVLLLSAGVGATPVLAMLHQLAAEHSGRAVWWVHTAHDAAQLAFGEEAGQLLKTLPNAHQQLFLTAGHGGRLSAATLAGLGLPASASAYLCGPQAFMDDMSSALVGLGFDPARLHTERFGAREAFNPGVTSTAAAVRPHPPAGPPGTGPQVTFARAGLTVRWSADRASLLTLAEACDVPTRWSCRTGVCHNCVTPLLGGQVTYEPEPLERPGPEDVLLCCSHPRDDVVLDL